jgi:type IV pilus assembly protein PilC
LFVSDFVSHNFLLLILILFSIFVLFVWYKNTRTGKIQIEEFIFWFPLVGKVYKNYVLSSVSGTFGSLIGSGVSVIKTLNLVGKASNSHIYEGLFEEISLSVSRWSKIVDAMKEVDPNGIYFPVDFLQMLSVWERTASLEKINKKISIWYEKEVDYSLGNLSKWIEPVAILIAWVFVLWFAFAIFWAILKVTQVVG